jgi:non-specific serine/threonine protein kinase
MPEILVTSILFDGHLALEWEENTADNIDRQKLETVLLTASKNCTPQTAATWLITLGLSDTKIALSSSLDFWREFTSSWIRLVRNNPDSELKRELFSVDLDAQNLGLFLDKFPPMVGSQIEFSDFLKDKWDLLNTTFHTLASNFRGSIDSLFQSLSPKQQHIDRIHFHLVENRKNLERPFAFLATYTVKNSTSGHVRHLPLKAALQEYADDKNKLLELLSTVNKVAKTNSLVSSFNQSGELFNPVSLTAGEAFDFLKSVHDFESAGILCRIPRWWKGTKKITVSLSMGNNTPSRVNFNALLDFKACLSIDNSIITDEEARQILEQAEGLAFIKGKWIAVDITSLQNSIELLDNARKLSRTEQISFADAMRLLMGGQAHNGPSITGFDVTCGEWLKQLLEKMSNPQLIRETAASSLLKTTLRPYQQQGLNWLNFLHSLGFGICLADDMGLGKTVQILAFLQILKAPSQCSLVVVPSSLLNNWHSEIAKFTPDLKTIILHPQTTSDSDIDNALKSINKYDIAITTYGMINRIKQIATHSWFYVICDEAQAIKNPSSRQTLSVKALKCKHRLVLTGTPVENRLSDLWSLFDFINPGLLGSFGEFKKFSTTLNTNPEGYGRLRRVVQPYILRRSKSDKSIISDLPDKVEIKTYCGLSKTQTILYQDLVNRLDEDLKSAEGIKRKGLVLSYLMKCKQLCNHPDHFSGSGLFDSQQSGKFSRLAEICETIGEKREKVLIFTQFKEIIAPLESFLTLLFGASGVTLSGSSTVKQRKEAVEKFQNSTGYTPFFILSLKAGGTGLNLTEANHVIHFDRWWNPAVENQATDRAYRIGQKKNVIVHKFICKGTIEDRIDDMMEDKKLLAGEILKTGTENWITEFDNKKIREMFSLSIESTVSD